MHHPNSASDFPSLTTCFSLAAKEFDAARQSLGLDIEGLSVATPDNRLASWWFASLETWMIDYVPESASMRPRSAVDLSHAIAQVHRWLAQWVDGDSNPFIHQQLYRHRFPQCIQDAYMALSCYLNRKPRNEQAIFHIIEEKARQLVEQDSLPINLTLRAVSMGSAGLDPFTQLARAQALLIYQMISLYDGNIRLRCVA